MKLVVLWEYILKESELSFIKVDIVRKFYHLPSVLFPFQSLEKYMVSVLTVPLKKKL